MTAVPTAPDTVTETVPAGRLRPGRIVVVPMSRRLETVTAVRRRGGFAIVQTDRTGPMRAYRWHADQRTATLTRSATDPERTER